jgi:TonB family protein
MSDDRQTPKGGDQHHAGAHPVEHQRTFDEPANVGRKKKLSTGAMVGIIISAILHVALIGMIYRQRFEMKMQEYDDEAVEVELIPPPPPPPPVITRPDWLRRPSSEDMARYYPERAQEREISGRAALACTVTTRGTLSGCNVASESPSGAGFGEAALRLANRFQMKPQTVDGKPVEAQTRFTITFQLPE